jgi:uncharacterized membrane protein (UPF0127 family)
VKHFKSYHLINQKYSPLIAALALAFLFSGCSKNLNDHKFISTTIGEKKFNLEIAKSEEAKRTGLSNRKKLEQGSGMIFLYDEPDYLQFWMKDTLIPLQLIFVNGCEIVDIQEMAVEQNPSAPTKIYKSKARADKAIELNKDSVNQNIIGRNLKELCNKRTL